MRSRKSSNSLTNFKKTITAKTVLAAMMQRVELNRTHMHPYQIEAYNFAMDNPHSALLIEMGLGKTVILGTLAVDLVDAGEVNKVLIIGPTRVARVTWPDEFRNWGQLCHHTIHPIMGTEAERKAVVDLRVRKDRGSFFSINREQVPWLVSQFEKKRRFPFDMVIIDESSSFKAHNSQRFKALRKVRPQIKRLYEATATPNGEGYTSLWAQIYLLDEGKRFGKSFERFRDRYFDYNRYNHKITPREGTEMAILESISDICLVMRAKDYLDREEYTPRKIYVNLDVEQTERYLDFEREMAMSLPFEESQPIIMADSAAILANKLLQVCSGVIYNTYYDGVTDDDKPIKKTDIYDLHDHKLDATEAFMLDAKEQGINVFIGYHFKSTRKRLLARFPEIVEMDKNGDNIEKWNKGKIQFYLAHPQSAGHGLNLQKGGHTVLFVDIPYSFETYDQFIGRLDRQGQKYPVTAYHFVARGVNAVGDVIDLADTKAYNSLRKKEYRQDWALETLKEIRARKDNRNHG